jgi:hypothetical protein
VGAGEPLRFADILTTASAVANYRGQSNVRPADLLDALDIVQGTKSLEDLGRPTSPLVRRPGPAGATDDVKAVVQRWFELLGSDPNATLDPDTAERFRADLRRLAPEG